MTLRNYLIRLHHDNASAIAESLDWDLAKLSLDSVCGIECRAIADTTKAYCDAIENVCGFSSPDAAYEPWWQARRAMEIVLRG